MPPAPALPTPRWRDRGNRASLPRQPGRRHAIQIHPYLTFDGTAREAITFYAGVLGNPVPEMMTFGAIPDAGDWLTEANRDRIAHAALEMDNAFLMVSDTPGDAPFAGHSGMSVNLSLPDMDRARALFAALSEGGAVQMPFEATF